MRIGKTLEDLAREITRQKDSKKDFIADTAVLKVVPHERNVSMQLSGKGEFEINELAHDQIGAHVKIPAQYYDRMRREAPELLANNIETWFKKYPAPRLLRMLDGKNRAFLSNGYRPLDNFDFANATLPVLAKRKLQVQSCEITEKRLYIKAVDEQLFRDVPIGYKMGDGSHRIFDTCAPVVILSNSEVGWGRLVIDTGVYTRACTNMCLFSDGGMKRTHLGARHHITNAVENIDHLLTERTKQKTDEALWLQVRDVISAAFDQGRLTQRLEKIAATAENKIKGKINDVMEVVAEKYGLNEGESDNVLKFLVEGGSLTQYGLHAAVTRTAQEADSYDRATELEYMGGKIVELPRTEWEALAA